MAFPLRPRWALAMTLCAAVLGGALVPSPALAAPARTTLSAAWVTRTVTRGATVTFAGKVSAASPARTVKLQRYYSSAWHTIRTARTAGGSYSLAVTTTVARTDHFRVLASATSLASTGVSRTQTLVIKAPPVIHGSTTAYRFLFPARARWNPCATIGYRVNATYATAGAITDAKGAISRIASATGLRFAYRGTTKVMPGSRNDSYPADTQIVIAWARPGRDSSLIRANASMLAGMGGGDSTSAYTNRGTSTQQIIDGYAVLNANLKLAAGFGSGPTYGFQGTRGQLLMHEIGHAVGLDHTTKDSWEIMNPVMSRKPAVFGKGDRTGLKALGSAGGCLYTTRAAATAAHSSN